MWTNVEKCKKKRERSHLSPTYWHATFVTNAEKKKFPKSGDKISQLYNQTHLEHGGTVKNYQWRSNSIQRFSCCNKVVISTVLIAQVHSEIQSHPTIPFTYRGILVILVMLQVWLEKKWKQWSVCFGFISDMGLHSLK